MRREGDPSAAIEREYRSLAEGVEPSSELGRYLSWAREIVLPRFVAADDEAVDLQQRHQRGLVFVYATAALVVGIVIFQTLFWPGFHELIWGEVALITLMLFVQVRDDRQRLRHRWMERRFLAEKLRCSVFVWPFTGGVASDAEDPEALSLLAPGERGRGWQDTVAGIDFAAMPRVGADSPARDLAGFLSAKWLEPQRRYCERSRRRNERTLKALELFGRGLLMVTIAAAVLHALGVGHHTPLASLLEPVASAAESGGGEGHYEGPFTVANALTLVAVLLPAVSASMSAIKHSLELHKLVLRTTGVLDGIARLEERLAAVRRSEDLVPIVAMAERFFMREHEDWYSLVSNKSVEVG